MKKFYSLSLALLCSAATAFAANATLVETTTTLPGRELKLDNDVVVLNNDIQSATTAAAEAAPASIVGKSYVTVYTDTNDKKYNYFFTVKAGADGGLVLEGFAEGYDVEATYDASTGKITIPVGGVIGNHPNYGDITLYSLSATATGFGASAQQPIVGTVDGDKIVFENGVYGAVSDGGLIVMYKITATEANAQILYSQNNSQTNQTYTFSNPLLVTKNSDSTIKVVGLSGILYGAYYDVTFKLDANARTVTLPFKTEVDKQYSQNRPFYIGGVNIVGSVEDLTLKAVTDEGTSLLTADKMVYVYSNGTNYNGYTFEDIKISIDFNVFTGEATGGDEGDTDTPTIDGISYQLYPDQGTATVTGCLATVTTLVIPSEITAGGKTYTVNAVAKAAFQANRTLTSVTFPASIKTVDTDAFRNLANLKSLYIEDLKAWCEIEFVNGNANPIYNVYPTSTSKWGKVYVEGKAVTALEIPEGVTSIGRAFYGFKALESIKLPSTLEVMGDQMLGNCESLTSVEVPASVKSIGSSFYGCKGLKSVKLSEGLETLGMSFSSCSALESIELPSTLKSIGMMAFSGCSALTEIKSHATEVPEAKVMAFDGVDLSIPVYVPAASMDAYKAAAEWMDFTNYKALPGGTSAIDEVAADSNAPVEYYSLQGVRVENPAAGLYVRKQGNTVTKVLVK